ncbi:hypothetical protein [Haliovirga abyssi]|uniref:Flagellar hook-length control protein FliK n=1 Tax=Haliovirga abyssi TaxID=2996794 RepID=A0AAU9DXD3_9FUSO|nr:hypothetical protein [Haliovirga abyssi]BDU51091.1 hypothetical protein HLVA_16600 [Haliovirga abyssi]
MSNFLRVKSKFLISTQTKQHELMSKLKKGEITKAKVIEVGKNNKILINIKGTEVRATTKRQLTKGDIIKLTVENISAEKIEVAILENDEESKTAELVPMKEKLNSKANVLKLKSDINIISREKGEILKQNDVEKIIKNFNKLKDKFPNSKSLLKSLVTLVKNGLEINSDNLKNIYSYYNGDINEKLKDIKKETTKEEVAKKIKQMLSESKDGDSSFKKGLNIINNLNKLNEKNIIEFMFLSEMMKTPAKIEVKYENSNSEDAENSDKKNSYYLKINLELENSGKVTIKIKNWNKYLDIDFFIQNINMKDEYMSKIKELKEKIEKMGYFVGGLRIQKIEDEKIIINKGVNLKI